LLGADGVFVRLADAATFVFVVATVGCVFARKDDSFGDADDGRVVGAS